MMTTVQTIAAAVVMLVLIGCVTVLAWHGTINGQAAIAFFSSLSLVGVIGGVQHAAMRAGAKAARGYIAPETTPLTAERISE